MTDDTVLTLAGYAVGTFALWMRRGVPLTTYQPKITELHNTINAQGKELVRQEGEIKLLQTELKHLQERGK